MPFVRRSELRAMSRLALPIVLAQVGIMSMGVVDTVMVGRVSAEALAAVALGNLYFVTLSIPSAGLLMVLDPLVSQAVGARDDERVALAVQRGLVLAVALAVVTSVVLWPVHAVLAFFRQPEPLVVLATSYVRISVAALLPFLAFGVLRQSLQAMHHTRAIVAVAVMANAVNAGLNWMLIYGHLGFPPMGVAGSAWATCASRWAMGIALLLGGWRTLRPALRPRRAAALDREALAHMVRLGAPIGLQQLLEIGVFAAIGFSWVCSVRARWPRTRSHSTSRASRSWCHSASARRRRSASATRWARATPRRRGSAHARRSSSVRDSCCARAW
jgi:MATE family multidrug resistance protein